MKVNGIQGSIQESSADTINLNLFEGVQELRGATGVVDRMIDGAISEVIKNGDFSGKIGEICVLYPHGKITAKRVIVVGLGEKEEFGLEQIRIATAVAIKSARNRNAKDIAIIVHGSGVGGTSVEKATQTIVESSLLALYRFDTYKSNIKLKNEIQSLTIFDIDENKLEGIREGIRTGEATAAGVYLTRDLVNMPANFATPTRMAAVAKEIAESYKMKLTIGDRAWAAERKMGAYLAVAKGAGEEPKFIILEHNADRDDLDTVVLVGKGITFDTGGISLKPSLRMGAMKSDMGGAAAVLGAMRTVGMLDIPLRIIGITPCTENMPDANAYRPADIIEASNGKTIEIISTDAEGRMILADALVYAEKFNPDFVVDFATLTGACVVAMGKGVSAGVFCTDEALQDGLVNSGQSTHERVWPLPLWEDYRKIIESDVADMENTGGQYGGVGTSAVFLKEFTNYPWAHIDIAGVALTDKTTPIGTSMRAPYIPRGGTGFGVRLIIDFLRNW